MDYAAGNVPGENRALEIQLPCIVFFILTPLFVGIRLWARLHNGSGLGSDDWTILVSFVSDSPLSSSMSDSVGRLRMPLTHLSELLHGGFGPDDGLVLLWIWPASFEPLRLESAHDTEGSAAITTPVRMTALLGAKH